MKPSQKWIFQRISALIVAPLIIWFLISLISLSNGDYNSVINFFNEPLFLILTITWIILDFSTLMIYGFAAGKIREWLKGNPRFLNTISACVLIVIAVIVAFKT